MGVNLYKSHLLVLPEDDANREIAVGFERHPKLQMRCFQIMPPAGGWSKVRDQFKNDYLPLLRRNSHCHVILLFDFDGRVEERRVLFEREIPSDVRTRVFLLGTQTEPEQLRKQHGKPLENIGRALADECHLNEDTCWHSPLLDHNRQERHRLNQTVKAFLFKD
jgi:hypothetical protein